MLKTITYLLLSPSIFLGQTDDDYNNTPYTLNTDWVWEEIHDRASSSLLRVADLNKDGHKEAIIWHYHYAASSDTSRIVILNNDLRTLYCEIYVPDYISSAYIMEQSDDSVTMYFATKSTVMGFDGNTCREEFRFEFPNIVERVAIDDIENDHILDIAYSVNDDLYLMAANDTNNQQVRFGFGSYQIRFFQSTEQGHKSIGVLKPHLIVLDGNDLSTINEFPDIPNNSYEIGDTDGDDNYEILRQMGGQQVAVFDILSGEAKAPIQTGSYLSVEATGDINGDGKDEVILYDLSIFDNNGNQIFDIDLDIDPNKIEIADFDGDNRFDLISLSDRITVIGIEDQQVIFDNSFISGPYHLSNTIIEDEGESIIAASFLEYDRNYEIGGALYLDTKTGTPSLNYFQHESAFWGEINDVEIGKSTQNGDFSLCYSGDNTNDEFIRCHDYSTSTLNWERGHINGNAVHMEIIDIDGDKINELFMISGNGRASVYQLENGFLTWHSNNVTGWIQDGFNDVAFVGDEIWWIYSGLLVKVNRLTGETVYSETTDISALDQENGIIYGAIDGIGFGILNPNTLIIDNMILAESNTIGYIDVSQDGLVALLGMNDEFSEIHEFHEDIRTQFIAIDGAFDPVDFGEIEIYDSNFPNQFEIYVSSSFNVKKFDLKFLNEHIFSDGFE